MKLATGHHWITHGVLVLILFFILGFIFSSANLGTTWGSKKTLRNITVVIIINLVILSGFYLING